eukprot:TRINITY_DN7748_c0_g2_i2.p2 TRINITY_DN7748_c0_g2~~TRINITY_DN7748_c0_g2_i2.p2  ORF type:complete len:120 (+),score=13.34 TRINITY_DN7748_c0_g2_i2:203-562(+)
MAHRRLHHQGVELSSSESDDDVAMATRVLQVTDLTPPTIDHLYGSLSSLRDLCAVFSATILYYSSSPIANFTLASAVPGVNALPAKSGQFLDSFIVQGYADLCDSFSVCRHQEAMASVF